MAIYSQRDIEITFSGDLTIDEKGDLRLGSALTTHKNALNFWLRTDHGGYKPDPSVGCNLGSFIGENNTEATHEAMEQLSESVLVRNLFSERDLTVTVVPFDTEEALMIVELVGTFQNTTGNFEAIELQRLAYSFPFIEGNPTPLLGS